MLLSDYKKERDAQEINRRLDAICAHINSAAVLNNLHACRPDHPWNKTAVRPWQNAVWSIAGHPCTGAQMDWLQKMADQEKAAQPKAGHIARRIIDETASAEALGHFDAREADQISRMAVAIAVFDRIEYPQGGADSTAENRRLRSMKADAAFEAALDNLNL